MHATEDQFETRHVLLPQISSEKENVIGIRILTEITEYFNVHR